MSEQSTETHEEKVTFTPAQQTKLDEIIKSAMGRAAATERAQVAQLTTQVESLQTALEAAKAAAADASRSRSERRESSNDVTALQAQVEDLRSAKQIAAAELSEMKSQATAKEREVATTRQQLHEERKTSMLSRVASQHNFVDVDTVATLTAKNFKWSDETGSFTIVDETGQEKLNAEYKPMSPEEFFADFAAKKPWLVKSDVRTGNASTESQRSGLPAQASKPSVEDIFGRTSSAIKASKLMRESPKVYASLKQEWIRRGRR
jgi:hypothetical protein